MSDEQTILKSFEIFSETGLHNHFREIDTSYYNHQLNSWGSEKGVFEKHQRLYEQELEERIHALLLQEIEDRQALGRQLQAMKHFYLEKLCLENFL